MPEIIAEPCEPDAWDEGSEPVRVMVVDDFPVVCMGLRLYLEHCRNVVVDCEAPPLIPGSVTLHMLIPGELKFTTCHVHAPLPVAQLLPNVLAEADGL